MDVDNDDQNSDNESVSEDDESSVNDEMNYWPDDFGDGYDDAEKLKRKTLKKIKLNDPDITSFEVELTGEYVQSIDWSTKGNIFGNNTQLKKVEIISDQTEDQSTVRKIKSFCTGLANNRSIEAFGIRDSELSYNILFSSLQPLLIHTNLIRIDIYESEIGDDNTRLLARALEKRSNKRSLEVLRLNVCDMGGEHAVGELIKALEGYENLTKLYLHDCGLGGRQCFVSLANILLKPNCRLETLELAYNNIGRPQNILANAISKNTSLKYLNFGRTGVDNEEAIEYCNALVKNNTIKFLNLSTTPMGAVGLIGSNTSSHH